MRGAEAVCVVEMRSVWKFVMNWEGGERCGKEKARAKIGYEMRSVQSVFITPFLEYYRTAKDWL